MTRIVVLAAGNDARGDDAIGPLLAARIAARDWPDVAVIECFQFQVENALDLEGAEAVLFIDAHQQQREPAVLEALAPAATVGAASHALTPAQVMAVHARLDLPAVAAWQLSVAGENFALGAPPSARALVAIETAWALFEGWLAGLSRGRKTAPSPPRG